MKSPLALLASVLLLSACGSDSKPTVSGQGSSQNGPAVACVELNGTYTRKVATNGEDGQVREESQSITIRTKVDGGVYQYSLNGSESYLPADGQIKDFEPEGQKGKLQVSCDSSSVTVIAKQEDQPAFKIRYVALSPTQLRVESDSEDAASLKGTYTKE